MQRIATFLRKPGAVGAAIAVVCVPLILLLGDGAGVVIAFAGLCLYPILDVPRLLLARSWWLGALISVVVWIVVFVLLIATVDKVEPLHEGAMIFMVPMMTYPIGLVISGLVRAERVLRGLPHESGQRMAAVLVTLVCGGVVVVPPMLNMVPILTERITGNTPGNTVYTEEGAVVSATPGQVVVRLGGRTESFGLGRDTKFGFLGPGWRMQTTPAGPAWLKAGQRVGLEYVYRARAAEATSVTIWVEEPGSVVAPK